MILVFEPPALPGVGTYGGFTFMLQDKTGGSIEGLDDISKKFIGAASQRPEIDKFSQDKKYSVNDGCDLLNIFYR
jgi:hypothetical protein